MAFQAINQGTSLPTELPIQALTRLASDRGSRHRRRRGLQEYPGCEGGNVVGGIAFSDSDDCDDNNDDGASSVSSMLRLIQD